MSVEFHWATALGAWEERAVVLLEMTAAVTCPKIRSIAAYLRTKKASVGPHNHGLPSARGLDDGPLDQLKVRLPALVDSILVLNNKRIRIKAIEVRRCRCIGAGKWA